MKIHKEGYVTIILSFVVLLAIALLTHFLINDFIILKTIFYFIFVFLFFFDNVLCYVNRPSFKTIKNVQPHHAGFTHGATRMYGLSLNKNRPDFDYII